jgi:NTE family protein
LAKADAVFEGGGVRGIAHAGALLEAEEEFGYEWQNVAGTSAGAIVAALVAAGHSAKRIRDIIWELDFSQLMDKAWEDRLGEILLYPTNYVPLLGRVIPYLPSIFEQYLQEKGKRVYGDLVMPGFEDDPKYRYRLRVIASDLTDGRMLVLPNDIEDFGINPDELSIAYSLRMSMSIPFFFEPVKLRNRKTGRTHIIVDGGILSNYPIWLFDAEPGDPIEWPTLGFNIYEPQAKEDNQPDPRWTGREIKSVVDLGNALWSTMFSAIDRRYISKRHWARTIPISSVGIKSTEFEGLDCIKKQKLLDSGQSAARSFLSGFNFEEYKQTWRTV